MKIKSSIIILIVVFLLVGVSFSSVNADQVRLSHEMSSNPDNPTHAFMLTLQHYLQSTTELDVEIYPDNVLGGMEAVIEQVNEGDIQIAQLSAGGLSHYYSEALIVNLPYAYPRDERVAIEVWSPENSFMASLFDDIEEKLGIKPMGIMKRGGFSVISNSVRPIKTLEDMEGLQLRGMDRSQIELYRALGADGVSVPWEEIYTALQTGVADGQMNPASIFLDASLYEVQDYITYPGIIPGTGYVVVNPDWYNGLDDNVRNNVDMALDIAFDTAIGLSFRSEALAGEELEQKGIEVYHQTDEQYENFREAGLEGILEWAHEQWGEEFVNDFMESIEATESKFSN